MSVIFVRDGAGTRPYAPLAAKLKEMGKDCHKKHLLDLSDLNQMTDGKELKFYTEN